MTRKSAAGESSESLQWADVGEFLWSQSTHCPDGTVASTPPTILRRDPQRAAGWLLLVPWGDGGIHAPVQPWRVLSCVVHRVKVLGQYIGRSGLGVMAD